ncbi:MAG TPA: hypothetical protein VFZ16_02500 [Hyphomicrobiaceae bacterium]|nr:hypothetical protein [Hyphomicrobiaceae bacterium]
MLKAARNCINKQLWRYVHIDRGQPRIDRHERPQPVSIGWSNAKHAREFLNGLEGAIAWAIWPSRRKIFGALRTRDPPIVVPVSIVKNRIGGGFSSADADAQHQGTQKRWAGNVQIDLPGLVLDSDGENAAVTFAARERGGIEGKPATGSSRSAGSDKVENGQMRASISKRLCLGAVAGDGGKLDVGARNLGKARRHQRQKAQHRQNDEEDKAAFASAIRSWRSRLLFVEKLFGHLCHLAPHQRSTRLSCSFRSGGPSR